MREIAYIAAGGPPDGPLDFDTRAHPSAREAVKCAVRSWRSRVGEDVAHCEWVFRVVAVAEVRRDGTIVPIANAGETGHAATHTNAGR